MSRTATSQSHARRITRSASAAFVVLAAMVPSRASADDAPGSAPVPAPSADAKTPPPPPPLDLDEKPEEPLPAPAVVPTEEERVEEVPKELPRLILDDGRFKYRKPKAGYLRVDIHGELQLRYQMQGALRLNPPVSDKTMGSLDQRQFLTTWLRVGGQLSVGEALKLVLQLDIAPGWMVGDTASGVSAAGDWARDDHMPSLARLRYAYLEWRTPLGLIRVGQMGSFWGQGMIANDGDRPMLFGDYRLGSIVERIAFATRPFGKDSPFVIAIAGDAVLQDNTSKWADGDRTYQGVLTAYYEKDHNFVGVYGVRRLQRVHTDSDDSDMRVWVLDATARGAIPVASDGTYVYAGAEIATIQGWTEAVRNIEHLRQDVRSYGGVANLGIVKQGKDERGRKFGRWVAQLSGGYASGDADPNDDVVRRFSFDPNYGVGLVLFPFLLHYETARAATNAMDPSLSARAAPGSRFLPSHGAVFGAQYLNPTLVYRPVHNFDVRLGAVIAVATSDVVDPFRLASEGSARNYRGGDAKARDLGIELDAGAEWRIPLPPSVVLSLGVQGGVLAPGHAFDGPGGTRMGPKTVVQGRLGLQF